MKETALVIMAAGIGSRFGGGIKQLAPVGPSGEIIMDYSIHDAIEAGFNKVVFIIRKDLEKDFKEIIGNRIEKQIPVIYAYQELNALPEGYEVTEGRTKPWGTGQAVLMVKGLIDCPFLVIICIDYKEWSIHHIFTAKNCLTCSPRFCSSCEFSAEFFWNIIKLLKCICYFYFFFNTVANDLFEIFLEIFADNEYNFVKPCF